MGGIPLFILNLPNETTMALLDLGRVCRKTRGRDAGAFCVIVGREDGKIVVSGADAKKNTTSARHIEPTPFVVDTKDVAASLKQNDLI